MKLMVEYIEWGDQASLRFIAENVKMETTKLVI